MTLNEYLEKLPLFRLSLRGNEPKLVSELTNEEWETVNITLCHHVCNKGTVSEDLLALVRYEGFMRRVGGRIDP